MTHIEEVQPLSRTNRKLTFAFLVLIFVVSIPVLYLYATGYRFDFSRPTNFIGTGGIYVAAERTGAEIYIDGELVRETRVFRRAFYAQNLDPKTHRVHVQKEGHHTWVKELPVTPHRVTEAQAFNLPLYPQVRVISEWVSATGSPIVGTSLITSSTTNAVIATSTRATSTFTHNAEFLSLSTHFATSTQEREGTFIEKFQEALEATTTPQDISATTTKESNGVRLSVMNDHLYATWIGPFEQMPYYYCAASFPRYSTSSEEDINQNQQRSELSPDSQTALIGESIDTEILLENNQGATEEGVLIHPVQTVPKDTVCDPIIMMDTKGMLLRNFDFFPGSTDLVVMELDDGIYVAEIDNRSWQNVQPLIMGDDLRVYIEGGNIYVYDGTLIYQVMFEL
jgi:hypothetical protein